MKGGFEASGGLYYNTSNGEAGGFASAGVGLGLNVSYDIFGGVIWGQLPGVTVNVNIVVPFVSTTLIYDPLSGELSGFTVGFGPPILGVPPFGLSETISLTGASCAFNCIPTPPDCLGYIK